MSSVYRTWVEINEQALRSNIRALRSLLDTKTTLCMVVKSNAYGHGLEEVVRIGLKENVSSFAVDNIDESLIIRQLSSKAEIIVLGYTLNCRLKEAVENDIDIVVYNPETLKHLQNESKKIGKQSKVHLKIETGTNRQGILIENLPRIIRQIQGSPNLKVVGVSTHYANIEDAEDSSFPVCQTKKYNEAVEILRSNGITPKHTHCACSAAIILYPETQGTLVRAGISLYGFWPSKEVETAARQKGRHVNLKPVLAWKTRVAQIKEVPAGSPIGYGLTEKLAKRSRIAVLPIGYWDGFDRGLSSIGEVLIREQRCKVLGRVCMNMCMVDISKLPQIEPEEEVVLIGRQGTCQIIAEDLAKKIDTIHYEIVTRINPNIPRIVI